MRSNSILACAALVVAVAGWFPGCERTPPKPKVAVAEVTAAAVSVAAPPR